ncbi:hypothetical protein SAV14893_076280 [Streptomyces avermitilis]|uniref:Uncharacterized protein n=1 Tax=Streptomyces avermitilis TaxID=33903 RepID=A0A4D4M8R4_STRAX|nr:hypothetical protein SAV14893_076280 [Streptomyces avermitilis]
MSTTMSEAVIAGAGGDELEKLPLPEQFAAATVRLADIKMFQDVDDKDVQKSLFVDEVPMPELAPDEALIAVMASSINYNTVWTAMFEPLPTFQFLKQMGKAGGGSGAMTSPTTWWGRTPQVSSCERGRPCASGRPETT